MILSGDLSESTLVDAFQILSSTRKTGILHASCADGEIRMYWEQGILLYAESSRLGLGLRVRIEGRVGRAVVQTAMEKHGGALGLAARELVREGLLEKEVLKALARETSWRGILDMFCWAEGGFEFSEGPFSGGDVVEAVLELRPLLLEASRRVQQMAEVRKVLPNLRAIFRLSELPVDSIRSIRLSGEEWAVLSLIDGRRMVEQLCKAAKSEEIQTLLTLARLLSAGLIVQVDDMERTDSGLLELGQIKYTRILEVYCELHSLLADRLRSEVAVASARPMRQLFRQLARAFPELWEGGVVDPLGGLPAVEILSRILRQPVDKRVELMVYSFGRLLLKELLILRHLLGEDAGKEAISDMRMVVQLGSRRYPEVSSKVLRHILGVLRQAETFPSRYAQGFDCFENHRYAEALRHWKSIPPSNPKHESAQKLMARVQRLMAGCSPLKQALERGENAAREGCLAKAIQIWQEAMSRSPREAGSGEETRARELLLRRLDLASRVNLLMEDAGKLAGGHCYEQARRVLQEAHKLMPYHPGTRALLEEITEKLDRTENIPELVTGGLELYRNEEYVLAMEKFERVLAMAPGHQLAADHLRFSRDRLLAMVSTTPEYSDVWGAIRVGNATVACEELERLLALSPEDSVAAYLLGEQKRELKACRLYEEAMTYCEESKFERAIELAEKALEVNPSHAESSRLRERCKRSLQEATEARELFSRAEALYLAGKIEEARDALDACLVIDPHNQEALMARAQVEQWAEGDDSTNVAQRGTFVYRPPEEAMEEEPRDALLDGASEHVYAELFDATPASGVESEPLTHTEDPTEVEAAVVHPVAGGLLPKPGEPEAEPATLATALIEDCPPDLVAEAWANDSGAASAFEDPPTEKIPVFDDWEAQNEALREAGDAEEKPEEASTDNLTRLREHVDRRLAGGDDGAKLL